MQEYKFGGSVSKRIKSRLINSIVFSGCGVSRMFIGIARWVNSTTVRLRARAERLKREAEPITIHVTRIIPLDRWTMRIEFTVDRKTRYCMHQNSLPGGYADIFAKFKRGEEVEIIDAHYHMIATSKGEWKKMV